jgi:hypothetical protein
MDIDFQKKFININFDKIIKQEFLDSIEYTQNKNQYFVETNINYNNYKIYQTELSDINKKSFNTKDKFIYTYIDENRKSLLKMELKNIILSQNKLLENFQHYITILNTNVTYIQPKQKSFLSKFFN